MSTSESSSNTRTKERISEIIGISEAIRHNSEVETDTEKQIFSPGKDDVVVIPREELADIVKNISSAHRSISYLNRVAKRVLEEYMKDLEDLEYSPEYWKDSSLTEPIDVLFRFYSENLSAQENRLSTLLSGSKEVKS